MKRVTAVGAIAAALLVGACGDDDMQSVATVKAVEYAFDMPDEVEGGLVKMNFENAGAVPHEFALGKLNEGRSASSTRERPWKTCSEPWRLAAENRPRGSRTLAA